MESLSIDGAWAFTPQIHRDDRGSFHEWFRGGEFADTLGYPMSIAQANCSVSRRGVIRGIHFADVPPGQAKYVSCAAGAILDVVVDLRTGSPTFAAWAAVQLDDENRRAVFLSEGPRARVHGPERPGHGRCTCAPRRTPPGGSTAWTPSTRTSASNGPRTSSRSCRTRMPRPRPCAPRPSSWPAARLRRLPGLRGSRGLRRPERAGCRRR